MQVVSLDGRILEKPRDRAHAVEMLTALSGRTCAHPPCPAPPWLRAVPAAICVLTPVRGLLTGCAGLGRQAHGVEWCRAALPPGRRGAWRGDGGAARARVRRGDGGDVRGAAGGCDRVLRGLRRAHGQSWVRHTNSRAVESPRFLEARGLAPESSCVCLADRGRGDVLGRLIRACWGQGLRHPGGGRAVRLADRGLFLQRDGVIWNDLSSRRAAFSRLWSLRCRDSRCIASQRGWRSLSRQATSCPPRDLMHAP